MAPTTSTPLRGLHVVHQHPQSPIMGEHLVDVVQQQPVDDDVYRRFENEGNNSETETDSNPETNPELVLTDFLLDYNNGKIADIKGKYRAQKIKFLYGVKMFVLSVCPAQSVYENSIFNQSQSFYLIEHYDAFI